MPFHIVLLVLLAALLHAGWNALLRAGDDRLWSMTVMCVAVAIASLIAACETGVLFAALIGYLFLGESLTFPRLLACAAIAAGTVMIG